MAARITGPNISHVINSAVCRSSIQCWTTLFKAENYTEKSIVIDKVLNNERDFLHDKIPYIFSIFILCI